MFNPFFYYRKEIIMDYIQLGKDNIKRFGIKTNEGKETGEYLEFDMEDIELPFRLQECQKIHDDNIRNLKAQLIIIDKKQDKKGKNLMSANEEAKMKEIQKFYDKEMEALDLFLGENGTKKLLNGRKPYLSMFDDISEYIKPILSTLQQSTEDIKSKIMKKYSKKEDDILE